MSDQLFLDKSTARVLLVDDSAFSRSLMQRELTDIGVGAGQIQQSSSGEDALTAIRASQHDLFILDIIMTGIDGIEVLKEIRKTQPEAKVVMCSGSNSESLIQDAVSLGIDAFVVKPYQSETFKKVMYRFFAPEGETVSHLAARCHKCDHTMVEVDAMDIVSFFCPKGCMKIGPLSVVLATQEELDKDYQRAKGK